MDFQASKNARAKQVLYDFCDRVEENSTRHMINTSDNYMVKLKNEIENLQLKIEQLSVITTTRYIHMLLFKQVSANACL